MSQDKISDVVKFASVEKARQLLNEDDEFTMSWSQFDIDSRMQKVNSTKDELMNLISGEVRSWTESEKHNVSEVLHLLQSNVDKFDYKIKLPDEIYIVKTTGREEGGAAGYTRSNYIVLKEDFVVNGGENLNNLIAHELFHVLSRNNPQFRNEMYANIGFKSMNKVDYPEEIKQYRLTNPDAPQTDSYVELKAEGEDVECMMIIYSKSDYNGGSFFKYATIGFLRLEGDSNKKPYLRDGHPVIYSFEQVEGFFEQVGRNTDYIIHPEEILADNFSFAMLGNKDLPSQEVLDKVIRVLKKE